MLTGGLYPTEIRRLQLGTTGRRHVRACWARAPWHTVGVENWSAKGGPPGHHSRGQGAGTIDEVPGELAGERLLDIGCGTGDHLADRGWAVEEVAVDPDMVTMSVAGVLVIDTPGERTHPPGRAWAKRVVSP